MKKLLGGAVCALALSACQTTNVPQGQQLTLEEVIRQIKSDVGQYNGYALQHADDAKLNNACGGKIDLTIKSVTVSVTTVTKESESGTLGAEVSPNAILKIGANAGTGQSFENSQTLTFTLVPVPGGTAPVSPQNSQLYLALKNLRESLLAASDTVPCLRFPPEDQENTLEFGFTETRSNSVGGAVNLFIFAIGGSRDSENTAAHTITIGFEGAGQAIQ